MCVRRLPGFKGSATWLQKWGFRSYCCSRDVSHSTFPFKEKQLRRARWNLRRCRLQPPRRLPAYRLQSLRWTGGEEVARVSPKRSMFRHDPEEQVESQKLDIHPNEKLEQMSGGGLKSRTGFHFCSEANTHTKVLCWQYSAAHHLIHLNRFLRLGNLHHAVGAHIGCVCCGHFAAPAVGEDLRKMVRIRIIGSGSRGSYHGPMEVLFERQRCETGVGVVRRPSIK